MNKRLYALNEQEFLELLNSGLLYKLYPELEGKMFNVGQFKEQKEFYELSTKTKQALTGLLIALSEYTDYDPEDIYSVLSDNFDNVQQFVMGASNLSVDDLEEVFEHVRVH